MIDKGLRPEEKVIVAGLQYVRAGMAVKAKTVAAKAASPAPVASPTASPASGPRPSSPR